ncbi:MAG: aminotransferase class I/II-fold pyridoxal phosphate-dependent enzyme [Acidimicrobiia bacterium]|nr:aminotransferase class I/II-fold pyridoxal phosphate-dependent enzyme [Acidimicrobiia bacterium]
MSQSDIQHHLLSRRGANLVGNRPTPAYVEAHYDLVDDSWDPESNLDGYVSMCIAENKLVWDLLAPKMATSRDVPARVTGYDAMIGAWSFRQALAQFLGSNLLGRGVDPEHVITLAGAGSVLETLFYAIADPGEGVLVPTPSYAGFWLDLEVRDGLHIVPVHTRAAEGFQITPELLDAAAARSSVPIRALLFTSPDNPLGRVYNAEEVEAIIAWTEERDIHLIVDEIYGLSIYADRPFVSAAAVRPSLGERIHIVWAFSKDFAASGLRCGVLVSENEGVLGAIEGVAYWSAVSGDTQYLLEQLISDTDWVNGFTAENRRRLGDTYRRVTAALDAHRIEYLPAEAGFFFLCDLRQFMPEPTWEGEAALWRRLLDEARVNLTPGAACRIGEPGFMRLCFAGEPLPAVLTGIERVGTVLNKGVT